MGYALAAVGYLPPGMAGTDLTVGRMQDLALEGTRTPAVRLAVENIIRATPSRDYPAETRAVESWVRQRLHFVRDGLKVETLKSAARMLGEVTSYGRFTGDCDDASILSAALLMSLGHPVSFQVLGRGRFPHHVNVLDELSGMTVDPTGEPRGHFGFRKLYRVGG